MTVGKCVQNLPVLNKEVEFEEFGPVKIDDFDKKGFSNAVEKLELLNLRDLFV